MNFSFFLFLCHLFVFGTHCLIYMRLPSPGDRIMFCSPCLTMNLSKFNGCFVGVFKSFQGKDDGDNKSFPLFNDYCFGALVLVVGRCSD